MLTVREALVMLPSFPLTRSWRLFTRPAHPKKRPWLLVNPAPDHPRSTRLTHRVLRTGEIDIDTPIACQACGEPFKPRRADAKFCSNACRQKAYRAAANPSAGSPAT